MILSTHILSEVEATCDRVIIIHRGRVLALDTPANLNRRIRRAPQVMIEVNGPPAQVLPALRAVPGVRAVEAQPGEGTHAVVSTDPDRDLREALAAAVVSRGWGLREIRPKTLTLEEIFLALVATTPSEDDEATGHLPA